MPTKVMFVGDLHGKSLFFERCAQRAYDAGVDTLMQLGDFGYWPHMEWGGPFLNDVQEICESLGLDLYWLDGNHENHDALRHMVSLSSQQQYVYTDGRTRVRYVPRGTKWTWHGVRFAAMGGAFSIDWRDRIHGMSVWLGETTSDYDVSKLDGETVDILLTHDAPVSSPFPAHWIDIPVKEDDRQQQAANMQRITMVRETVKPAWHFHGHWHYRYTHKAPDGCITVGLSSNTQRSVDDATFILDLSQYQRNR